MQTTTEQISELKNKRSQLLDELRTNDRKSVLNAIKLIEAKIHKIESQ